MKKYLFNLLIASVAVFGAACSKDDDGGSSSSSTSYDAILSGTQSSNFTMETGKKYLIRGNVFFTSGTTLTIEPGAKIFGEKSSKGALIINNGATLDAVGTSSNPIIMTSDAPAGFRNRGDWGGLVWLGDAVTSDGTGVDIEGIPTASGATYGGSDAAYDGGTLQYCRIEFAGIALSPNNELNSLTMGALGSGTVIDHIMVSYAGDDGLEAFGGSNDIRYVVTQATTDDDLDWDKGNTGTVQWAFIIRDAGIADQSGSSGFEISGGTTTTVFANITCVGPSGTVQNVSNSNFLSGLQCKSGSPSIRNVIVAGWEDQPALLGTGAGMTFNVNGFVAYDCNTFATDAPSSFTNTSDQTGTPNSTLFASSFLNGGATWADINDVKEPFIASGATLPTAATGSISGGNGTSVTLDGNLGAFGAAGNTTAPAGWNWNAGWLEFDAINAVY